MSDCAVSSRTDSGSCVRGCSTYGTPHCALTSARALCTGRHPARAPHVFRHTLRYCRARHSYALALSWACVVRYKTELCKSYHVLRACPFSSRCKFIHDEYRLRAGELEYWLVSPTERLVRVELVHPLNAERRALLEQLVSAPPWTRTAVAHVQAMQQPTLSHRAATRACPAANQPSSCAREATQSSKQLQQQQQQARTAGAPVPARPPPPGARFLEAVAARDAAMSLRAAAHNVGDAAASVAPRDHSDGAPRSDLGLAQARMVDSDSAAAARAEVSPLFEERSLSVASPILHPRTPPLQAPSPFLLRTPSAAGAQGVAAGTSATERPPHSAPDQGVLRVTSTTTAFTTTSARGGASASLFYRSSDVGTGPSPGLFGRSLAPGETAQRGSTDDCGIGGCIPPLAPTASQPQEEAVITGSGQLKRLLSALRQRPSRRVQWRARGSAVSVTASDSPAPLERDCKDRGQRTATSGCHSAPPSLSSAGQALVVRFFTTRALAESDAQGHSAPLSSAGFDFTATAARRPPDRDALRSRDPDDEQTRQQRQQQRGGALGKGEQQLQSGAHEEAAPCPASSQLGALMSELHREDGGGGSCEAPWMPRPAPGPAGPARLVGPVGPVMRLPLLYCAPSWMQPTFCFRTIDERRTLHPSDSTATAWRQSHTNHRQREQQQQQQQQQGLLHQHGLYAEHAADTVVSACAETAVQ